MIKSVFVATYVLLAIMLWKTAKYSGIPKMVSDTYYQLRETKEESIFSAIMTSVSITTLFALCSCAKSVGNELFAIIGCIGLLFVALAPNYLDKHSYKIHKAGAIVAAIGCVGWCVNVCPYPTFIILGAYILYLIYINIAKRVNKMWHLTANIPEYHPWYWAEVAGFLDVYITYAIV